MDEVSRPVKPRRRIRPLKATQSQGVTRALRAKILHGDFPPGSHLQEEGLAEQLGTSRTPIRTALAALAQESLLTYLPNRGYQVPRFSLDDIMKAYDVRGALEGMAARQLAEAGVAAELEERIRSGICAVDEMLRTQKLVAADQADWRRMNIEFHEAIQSGVNNRFLSDALAQMRNIPMVSNAMLQWYDYETVRRYHADHHAIFDAIARRQGSRAEALMREHIYRAQDFVRQSFDATA